eukprot:9805958-Alexandrium_andersonii.AAC.1
MSASLVGSEMCIRDRAEPAESADAKQLNCLAPDWLNRHEPARWLNRPEPCLLYTSDAADDM